MGTHHRKEGSKLLAWSIKSWEELTKRELYSILSLRSEVFVVEQTCIYQDIDNKDHKAHHVLGFDDNQLVAYSRIFNEGDYFKEASFGRAVTSQKVRGTGVGHLLVKETLQKMEQLYPKSSIKISAQAHLQGFYSKQGFKTEGPTYLEDNIPHVAMFIRK
jgi:ElaA protein